MATVEMFLEEKERGLYRVEIEVGFPMLRRKEFFASTGAEALRMALWHFEQMGVDDRAAIVMSRPALQADIDRAQGAQQAAGDVTSAREWRDGSLQAMNSAMASVTGIIPEMIDREAADFAEAGAHYMATGELPPEPAVEHVIKRGPGRPRKEA